MRSNFNVFALMVVGLSALLPIHAQQENLKPALGTWVRVMPKPAPPASATNKVTPVGNGFHFVGEYRNAKGGLTLIEYTVDSFDGKNYPWKATDENGKLIILGDAISFEKVDDYTYDLLNKYKGEIVMTQQWVISKDGKTRTVTDTRLPALDRLTGRSEGKRQQSATATAIYEKQ